MTWHSRSSDSRECRAGRDHSRISRGTLGVRWAEKIRGARWQTRPVAERMSSRICDQLIVPGRRYAEVSRTSVFPAFQLGWRDPCTGSFSKICDAGIQLAG